MASSAKLNAVKYATGLVIRSDLNINLIIRLFISILLLIKSRNLVKVINNTSQLKIGDNLRLFDSFNKIDELISIIIVAVIGFIDGRVGMIDCKVLMFKK